MSNLSQNKLNRSLREAKKLVASQSYAEAEKLLSEIVSEVPAHGLAWQELGNTYYKRKDFSKAVEAYQRRYGLEPDHPAVNYSLGISLTELGRADEARMFLKRAVEIKPDFTKAIQRLELLGNKQTQITSQPNPAIGNQAQKPQKEHDRPLQSSEVTPPMFSKDLQQGEITPGRLLFDGRQRKRFMVHWFLMAIPFALLMAFFAMNAANPTDIYGALLIGVLYSLPIVFIFLLIKTRSHSCQIYERRIDYQQGFFFRNTDSLWLYELTNVSFQQPLLLRIFRTAKIVLESERQKSVQIVGIARASKMKEMWEDIRDASLSQRRDIKGLWV